MAEKMITIVTVDDKSSKPDNKSSSKLVSKGSSKPDNNTSNSSSLVYRDLPIEKLKDSLNDFTDNVSSILQGVKKEINNYQLDEVELNVELSASGSIRLIGSVEVGTTGAIKLTFKRHDHE